MRIRLEIIDPTGRRTPFESTASILSVGRLPDNDIVVSHEKVSAKHALIEVRQNEVFVSDLRSTNKTFLNEQELSGRRTLTVNDRVGLGASGPVLRIVAMEPTLPSAPGPALLPARTPVGNAASLPRAEMERVARKHQHRTLRIVGAALGATAVLLLLVLLLFHKWISDTARAYANASQQVAGKAKDDAERARVDAEKARITAEKAAAEAKKARAALDTINKDFGVLNERVDGLGGKLDKALQDEDGIKASLQEQAQLLAALDKKYRAPESAANSAFESTTVDWSVVRPAFVWMSDGKLYRDFTIHSLHESALMVTQPKTFEPYPLYGPGSRYAKGRYGVLGLRTADNFYKYDESKDGYVPVFYHYEFNPDSKRFIWLTPQEKDEPVSVARQLGVVVLHQGAPLASLVTVGSSREIRISLRIAAPAGIPAKDVPRITVREAPWTTYYWDEVKEKYTTTRPPTAAEIQMVELAKEREKATLDLLRVLGIRAVDKVIEELFK